MKDLLERLRKVEPDRPGVRTRWHRNPDGPEAADEIERLRLTDAEREAVRFCVTASLPETEKLGGVAGALCRMHAATLRGLLERMGDCPASDNVADRNNGTTGPTNGRKVGSEHAGSAARDR